MPFTGQKKIEYQRAWRKEAIKNGYGKYLYRRRALRNADESAFRQALERLEKIAIEPDELKIIREAFAASDARWAELGSPPHASIKASPAKQADDTLLQALSKLELEQ